MALNEFKIKSAKPRDKRYQIADSDGLYLEIMTSGKKYWRLRYIKEGKRSWHTIGEYPAPGVQEARGRRNNLRGDKDISAVTPADILPLLQRLAERENWEMLSRIRSITSQIFRYGVATGRCATDPTYALRGAIITPRTSPAASTVTVIS